MNDASYQINGERLNRTDRQKVMVVMGTRPEAIKLAPVVLELAARLPVKPLVVATAQHREMLDQVLDLFGIRPDYDLNLMVSNQSLFHVTEKAIGGFEKVISETEPGLILVQGDTTTAFVGALAGYYGKIPVGHVEAGLRTGNKYSPFPEEINRRLVSVIADVHFAPTERNRANLMSEGVPEQAIVVTGNTVIDALKMTAARPLDRRPVDASSYEKTVLITAHRRENFGKPLQEICEAVREMSLKRPSFLFVYPVHLNTHVQETANAVLRGLSNVVLLPPMEYHPFVHLMAKADLILTDSGGIQEEAPSLGKPVLVLRNP
jgi:UDP-N-acetylglucosamine 2-epimerase (non-hydrolysing)